MLLAVLVAAPVVRTLCAWDCGPSSPAARGAAASPDQAGHCAHPAGSAESESARLDAVDGCDRCEALGETVRATVRTESTSLATALPAPARSGPGHDLTSSDLAPASTRAASPPLRAPYPLRI